MKRFVVLSLLWIIGLILIPINKSMDESKIIKGVEDGQYYSDDIELNNPNIYEARNSNIIFKDGKYEVTYDIYAKCTKYYSETGYCADNNEHFVEKFQGSGTYEIKGTTLNLFLGKDENLREITRVCEIDKYDFSIDCTDSGGWEYYKIN